MSTQIHDDYHHQDDDCVINTQENYFNVAVDLIYGSGLSWTKKDLVDYNKIFEGLDD